MTEADVSYEDAQLAFEKLIKFCNSHECGSCMINHMCGMMRDGGYDNLKQLSKYAANYLPRRNESEEMQE